MRWLYDLITSVYFAGIHIAAALGNRKARLWRDGRKSIFQRLRSDFQDRTASNRKVVWMHCASLGEFEQGRTLLESLKKHDPDLLVLLTFFSPSGFEIRKDYKQADFVYYLPADSAAHARQWIAIVRPALVIFVKYEFWYYYLQELKAGNIPVFLVAAVFRSGQPFFRWYGGLHRRMLGCFRHLFVQDTASRLLLEQTGCRAVTVAGDPRTDRVLEITRSGVDFPAVREFCGKAPVLVCGSTWDPDEKALEAWLDDPAFRDWKVLLAPHDVSQGRIREITNRFGDKSVCYTRLTSKAVSDQRVLIIDTIGMLSALYAYGRIAFVGGGFGSGLHNILEPMAFGLPVIFGPKYDKFYEAKVMVDSGGCFSIDDDQGLRQVMKKLTEPVQYEASVERVRAYMEANRGATGRILPYLKEVLY